MLNLLPNLYFSDKCDNFWVLSAEHLSCHFLAPGMLRWLLNFWKIFAPLEYDLKKIDGKTLLVEFQGTKHSWDGEEYIDGCNRRRMVAIAWLKAGVLKLKRSG